VFFQAFGVALSNPKAIMFLTALFPQFLQIDLPLVPQFFRLIVILMAFSFSFLMLYALLAHQAAVWLQQASRKTLVNRASGSIFVGFGVLLATSSSK
jgi:threonine/homoserine/homoserine lactone efflux protein